MAQGKRGGLLLTTMIFSNEELLPLEKGGWEGFKNV